MVVRLQHMLYEVERARFVQPEEVKANKEEPTGLFICLKEELLKT